MYNNTGVVSIIHPVVI